MNSSDNFPFFRYESEKYYRDVEFFDPDDFEKEKFSDSSSSDPKILEFPSLLDSPSIYLSVIIPAKDEEKRLPAMLDECLEYLERKCRLDANFTYEIIVVDDFSSDKTTQLALTYAKRFGNDKFRVLTLERNRGKGGAVRFGFWAARGRRLLFADADGATKFDDLDKLSDQMDVLLLTTSMRKKCSPNGVTKTSRISDESDKSAENNETNSQKKTQGNSSKVEEKEDEEAAQQQEEMKAVAVGSRAHLEKESIVERTLFRTILMFGFHFLVWLFCVKNIRDTQCGFKLFTRSAARVLFWNLHVERWAFDVELLYLAEKLKIPVAEVPVTWHEVAGSKLTPLAASIEMARDLFMIWFRYFVGVWTIKSPPSAKKRV